MNIRIIAVIAAILLASGSFYLMSRFLSSGSSYRPDAQVIEKLHKEKPARAGARTVLGRAWKEYQDGNIILEIAGSPYEMGYRHGVLLKDEIVRGVVPEFADPVRNSNEFGGKPAWFRWLVHKYLEFRVYGPLERHTPREYLEELKGIADGSGLGYRTVFKATFMSELGMIITAGMTKKKARKLGIPGECSDFAVSGPATVDGKLLVGRNTDYPGQGRWMSGQTVFLYRPDNAFAYINVSTAGLIKCNAAMNEKGVVIGGHFMAFENTTARGLSFTVLEHEIMRKSAGLEEAIAIVKKDTRAGAFAFTVSDGKSREAVVIEANADAVSVRRMKNNSLCLSNCATTPELRNADLAARYGIAMRDKMGRLLRLEELIAGNYGRITPGRAAEFMGDHLDYITRTERGAGVVVGASHNVTSMVFMPEDGLVWIATGSEPACNSPFAAFDFRSWLRGTSVRSIAPLPGYRWKSASREKGFRAFMLAYTAYENNRKDTDTIIGHLDTAISADPDEPVYVRLKAGILIHAGNYKIAVELLGKSLRLTQSANERAQTHVLMGQALDLAGHRDQALLQYRAVDKLHGESGTDVFREVNAILRGYNARYISRPFTIKDINEVIIGFSQKSGLE